jgi:hypothetical protein
MRFETQLQFFWCFPRGKMPKESYESLSEPGEFCLGSDFLSAHCCNRWSRIETFAIIPGIWGGMDVIPFSNDTSILERYAISGDDSRAVIALMVVMNELRSFIKLVT